jgi:hypothetical protein
MKQKQQANQATMTKRLSPELAEVLHMLKALEAKPVDAPPAASLR